MRSKPTSTDWNPIETAKNVFTYLRAKDISRFEKFFVIVLTLAYVLSPIDAIPDVFFPFGVVDDIGVLLLVVTYMNHRVGQVGSTSNSKSGGEKMKNDDDIVDVDAKDVTDDKS